MVTTTKHTFNIKLNRPVLIPDPPLKHGDMIVWGHDYYWVCYKHKDIYTIVDIPRKLLDKELHNVQHNVNDDNDDNNVASTSSQDLFHGMEDRFFYEEECKQ